MVADIPGLIEGAHAGAGLGHQFLRHIERTRLIVHLLDGASPDPLDDYAKINQELRLFSEKLATKPQIIVLNKIDLPQAREQWPRVQEAMQKQGQEVMAISALTREGVPDLVKRMAHRLAELPPAPPELEIPVIKLSVDEGFTIEQEAPHTWRVRGRDIENLVARTFWEYEEAVDRFQRILDRMGITDALLKAGVQDGDTVYIGDMEMVWGYE